VPRVERVALCDDLGSIEPGQWDVQSLCSARKIRHVVAHLVRAAQVTMGGFVAGMLKNGMNFGRYIGRQALAAGTAPPQVLLAGLKDTIGKRPVPPMITPVTMLSDIVCHSADMRRPLGISRTLPEETLIEAADSVKTTGFPFGARKPIAGLRLVATDATWPAGDGPQAGGPLKSLILAMAGRPAALEDLSGDGTTTLKARS
jgi:uncharacterized protein (TIGR03083 family)